MYYCKNCGAEISANMRFCSACGTPAEMEAAPGDAAKPVISSPKKVKLKTDALPKFAVPALAVVAMAALVILAIGLFKPSKYEITKGKNLLWTNPKEEIVVLVPYGKSKVELDGYLAKSVTASADGTKSLVLIDEFDQSPDSKNFEGYSMYFVSDKVTLITDGVFDSKISASGNVIAFVKDYDYAAQSGTLYIWNNGKTTLVSDSMCAHKDYCISPDGKTVAFAKGTLDDYSGAYYNNGHISDLGKSVEPFAVADKARYIYYTKNYSSYVMLGNDGGTKQKLADQAYPYYFNKDLSQMVYQANGKTYAIIKGKEKITL
ncbi:MAG: zinc ribbon domain-containing protein, partial [Clostridiales bacterium]|nr:zinc ribbon domain-containing protein [Clostridiales bacterium]